MSNLSIVSNQWATRPNDERFLSLDALETAVGGRDGRSVEKRVLLSQTAVQATETDITLRGPSGNALPLTHWAFGQLCARAGAPAGYLRTLPAPLAVQPLAWSLTNRRE